MNSNMFFEQNGRAMYGNQFGYAIEYEFTRGAFGMAQIRFKERLIMPDDPQNWERPLPTDIASELLFVLAKEERELRANLYGTWVKFNKKDTLYDIKRRIRQLQLSFINVDSSLPEDIKKYLQDGVFNLIKDMPVH